MKNRLGSAFKPLLTFGAGIATEPAKRGKTSCFLKAFLVGGILGAGESARSQDLGELEAEVPAQAANAFVLNESNFNQWIFGNAKTDQNPEDRLRSLLTVSVADVERACPLSEPQKRKLLLAGTGDIKRFTDRVAEARAVFEQLKSDQNNINEIFQSTQPLTASLAAGLFGDGSIYTKTLGTTLSADQAARYREVLRERKQFLYRSRVALGLAKLDAAVGFTTEQYHKFAAVILAETTPPERPAGQSEADVMLWKIAQIPEDKIQPIFDDARWLPLSQLLAKARWQEPMLRANGALDPINPAKADKPAVKNDPGKRGVSP